VGVFRSIASHEQLSADYSVDGRRDKDVTMLQLLHALTNNRNLNRMLLARHVQQVHSKPSTTAAVPGLGILHSEQYRT
jgi:hypothetical protein